MRKRLCALMMTLAALLSACGGGGGSEAEETLNTVRARWLEMTACAGHLDLTADYGRRVYEFGVDFTWAKEGETVLTLTSPEEVAGVKARIAEGETALEYDGVMVETGPLNAEGLSPMDALPALLAYAREGYAAECALEDWDGQRRLYLLCRDPEGTPGAGTEAALWFDPDTAALVRGELSRDGAVVLMCTCTDFTMEGPDGTERSSEAEKTK